MTRVRVADVTLAVWQEGQGLPVLLLHGFPTRNLLWKEVIPGLLSGGCRAIAPDLAGYGTSEAPPDVEIHMANQAQWMLGLLDVLRIDRCLVVAHDVGTAVAQVMAVRAPPRVAGLVLIDGVHADAWGLEAVAPIAEWDPAAAWRLFRVLVRRLRGPGGTSVASEETIREILAPHDGQEGGLRLIRAARGLDPRHTTQILDELSHRHPPSLVLWGDSDGFLPAETVGRPLAALLGAELKLLPGGHFLPLDQPLEISREILQFARSSKSKTRRREGAGTTIMPMPINPRRVRTAGVPADGETPAPPPPLKIVHLPNPVLRKQARRVARIDQRIKKLLDDMLPTMHAAPGIGLAAPQVGESIQAVVIEIDQQRFQLCNPEIVEAADETTFMEEGCLSIPSFRNVVERAAEVVVKARTRSGRPTTIRAKGLLARCFQHEVDHLKGKLICDYPHLEFDERREKLIRKGGPRAREAEEAAAL